LAPLDADTSSVGRQWRRSRSLGWFRLGALVAGVVLVGVSVGLGIVSARDKRQALDRDLLRDDRKHLDDINEYFGRARDLMLLQAQNDSFADFYAAPGDRVAKVNAGNTSLDRAVSSLNYLQSLYGGRIGEICFIDRGGAENARLVWGTRAATSELSPNESTNPFFGPTLSLGIGKVYQAAAYISPDTHDLVISNSTLLPDLPPGQSAMIHFEVSMASFAQIGTNPDVRFVIVDADTGTTLADSFHPGAAGKDHTFQALVGNPASSGVATIGASRVAFEHLYATGANANNWFVIATAPVVDPGLRGYVDEIGRAHV